MSNSPSRTFALKAAKRTVQRAQGCDTYAERLKSREQEFSSKGGIRIPFKHYDIEIVAQAEERSTKVDDRKGVSKVAAEVMLTKAVS